MVTITLAPAATRRSTQATSPRYVPNEIIIKFRETAASAFEKQLGRGRRASEFTISEELDELNARHAVQEIKPLFKDFKKNRQRLKALLRKEKSLLTRKEKRILRRLKRAPKDAKVPDLSRIYKIQVGPAHGRSLEEVVEAYKNNPDVEYAHLNYIVSICAEPSDSLYPIQWPLNNTGQKYPPSDHSGTSDCDIDAPEAWNINTGSSEVVVAVIDSGVDCTHRDIDDNMWVNEAESAGTEDVDDDENGYIDDIYGYDFINTDSDPNDDYGHGTHCSGIIAAEGNNGLDITGVCWNAKVMALKFINHLGEGSVAAATEAFDYAIENGADVISNSWGVPGVYINECESLQEAVEYAYSQGIVMVASAGNDGWDFPSLPAAYEHVIAVAATDSNDQKAWFSNYGNWVDIAAPGVDVLSLLVSGMSVGEVYDDYTTVASGTSMSCPHVAGACALVLSNCPDIQVDVLEQVLLESTDQISPGTCTSGRLNIYKALAGLSAGVVRLDRDVYPCSTMPVSILVRDLDLIGEETQEITLTTSGGDSETVTLNETSPLSGVFVGTISTNTDEPNTEDGFVQVSHGETITVMYEDTDDGTGNPATVEDTAAIDCVAPVISNVQVEMRGIAAKITFETDEPTTGQVRCALECGGSYLIIGEDLTLSTTHSILLLNLANETDYYFVVDANDAAGNQTTDDNGGICYLFTTSTPFMLRVPSEYPAIQAAIDEAWDCGTDTVLVADGTYTGAGNRDIGFKGKSLTVKSENGPENCIIDCQANSSDKHRGFKFHTGEGPDSILNGFTITNGYGPEEQIGGYIRSVGGAIYCKESSPRIDNCIIRGNKSDYKGGGIYAYNLSEPFDYSKPTVIDCTISENQSQYGGALCSCNGPIINCTISENSVKWGGGGLYCCRGPIGNCTIIGNSSDSSGGGVDWCDGPISNCTISGNSADYMGGGLIYCWGPISNCIISGNSARSYGGGGLSNCNYGPISNCLIIGNSTTGSKGGGGLHECNAEIINCTIAGNSAGKGGGIYDTALTTIPWGWPKPPYTTPVTNCILWDNEATTGSQIYLEIRGRVGVSYSDVQGGEDDVCIGRLGGYLDWGDGNIDADPCFVEAGYWGDVNDPNIIVEPDEPNAVWTDGDYHLLTSSPCINTGDPNYEPVPDETDMDGEPRVINGCVDIGVDEVNYEGPFIAILPTAFELCVDEGGPNPESQILSISNIGTGTLDWEIAEDCPWLSVEPKSGSSTGETDNITMSVDIAALVHGLYHCELAISCPNTVNSPQIIDVDLFVLGPAIIELSAMEFVFFADWHGANPPAQTLTIRNSGSGTLNWEISYDREWLEVNPHNGSSTGEVDEIAISIDMAGLDVGKYNYCELTITDPNYGAMNGPQTVGVILNVCDNDGVLHVPSEYETIQSAINWSEDGDTVIVAQGTYTGDGNRDIDFLGKAVTARSTDPHDPNVVAQTVINCESNGRGFYFHLGEGEDSVIDGFTISNGYASRGGGIYCEESSPTINNCVITTNSADRGGGIYNEDSSPTIIHCTITGNLAYAGGGIHCQDGTTVSYCVITENLANEDGGGILCVGGDVIISHCMIIGNSATYSGGGIDGAPTVSNCTISYNTTGFPGGGGIYCCRRDAKINNCIFVGNSGSDGGGIYNSGGNQTISNCTIIDNSATGSGYNGYGGGIFNSYETISKITNCIVRGNTNTYNEPQIGGSGFTTVSYSDVQGGWGGIGNIDTEPFFADAANGDYHLNSQAGRWDPVSESWVQDSVTSHCIDAGSPASDWTAELWPHGKLINMGAFGGTLQASMSLLTVGNAADLNIDDTVDFQDFAEFAVGWEMQRFPSPKDLDRNGIVNFVDFAIFVDNWLWQE